MAICGVVSLGQREECAMFLGLLPECLLDTEEIFYAVARFWSFPSASMNENQSKSKAFSRRAAVVGGWIVCFAAGVAFQFALSRWGPSHPQIKTVRSDASNSWAFMSGGTWPPSRYPVEAFEGMQTEVKEILESVIGSDEALGRYVYVLPAFSGNDVISAGVFRLRYHHA